MSVNVDEIRGLIAEEIVKVKDPKQRNLLKTLIATPYLRRIRWQYGSNDEHREVWVVGQSGDGAVALVYDDGGFGPAFPWGFIFPGENSLGMDAQWHSGLEDAAIAAGLLNAPAGYVVPGPR
jgi:hypothetical protein